MQFRPATLDELTIDDRAPAMGVAIYQRLETFLRGSGHRFLIPEAGQQASWDRALFLNLTYWNVEAGADVLCDDHIPADVVAHVAWHELATRQIARARAGADDGPRTAPTSAGLFFAESIASAFDLYLVGRLLPRAADSDFLATQVPLMAECADNAGLPEAGFAALLEEVTRARSARSKICARCCSTRRARSSPVRRRPRPTRRWKSWPATGSRRSCTTTSSRTGSSTRAPTRPARPSRTRSCVGSIERCERRPSRSTGSTRTGLVKE